MNAAFFLLQSLPLIHLLRSRHQVHHLLISPQGRIVVTEQCYPLAALCFLPEAAQLVTPENRCRDSCCKVVDQRSGRRKPFFKTERIESSPSSDHQ